MGGLGPLCIFVSGEAAAAAELITRLMFKHSARNLPVCHYLKAAEHATTVKTPKKFQNLECKAGC